MGFKIYDPSRGQSKGSGAHVSFEVLLTKNTYSFSQEIISNSFFLRTLKIFAKKKKKNVNKEMK